MSFPPINADARSVYLECLAKLIAATSWAQLHDHGSRYDHAETWAELAKTVRKQAKAWLHEEVSVKP